MSATWLLKNLLGTLLLPPANGLLLLLLAGFFRKRRWAFWVAVCGGGLLFVQSLPPVASTLMATLEQRAGPVLTEPAGAQAIVVLGSGLNLNTMEYGNDTATERTLVRLRYGATLARRYQLPVLASGGMPPQGSRSEAEVIAEILEQEFGVPVRWRETKSEDTADNATMSAAMLRAAGIRRIILVTQAFHMPRARRLFEAAGLEVIPGPTDFKSRPEQPLTAFDWLPKAGALYTSYSALHEWLGLLWIELRPR